MDFAGREYIYLPQKKIDKLNGYKSEDNKVEEENVAPLPQINEEKNLIEKKEEYEEEEIKEKEAALPPINLEKNSIENKEEVKLKKYSNNNLIKIEDEAISCDSNNSNSCCAISNKHLNDKYSNNGSYEDNLSCDSFKGNHFCEIKDEKEEKYFQETDLNIFCVDYNKVLSNEFSLKENPIRCKKCTAVLNMYSNLNLIENDKYKWEC